MPMTVSSWIRIDPTSEACVVRMRTTPDQMSSPASVTTKEGTPAFVITSACTKPIAVVMRRAAGTASHHGQPGSSGRRSIVMTTPPTALTKATERSISPMSSTKTTPIAIVAIAAVWRRRFVKLRSVRNVSSRSPKVTTMIPSPTIRGSDPSSPNFTPCHHSCTYADSDCSGACSRSGAPAGGTALSVTLRSRRGRPCRERARCCRR